MALIPPWGVERLLLSCPVITAWIQEHGRVTSLLHRALDPRERAEHRSPCHSEDRCRRGGRQHNFLIREQNSNRRNMDQHRNAAFLSKHDDISWGTEGTATGIVSHSSPRSLYLVNCFLKFVRKQADYFFRANWLSTKIFCFFRVSRHLMWSWRLQSPTHLYEGHWSLPHWSLKSSSVVDLETRHVKCWWLTQKLILRYRLRKKNTWSHTFSDQNDNYIRPGLTYLTLFFMTETVHGVGRES